MWLENLRLILPDRIIRNGCIRIQDGTIAEIREGSAPANGAGRSYRVAGLTAAPGIIDMHGDMIERELEPRPNARLPFAIAIQELDKRLAAAGVTTAFAAVSFSEISIRQVGVRRHETAQELVTAIHNERKNCLVDWRIHARFEVTNQNAPPLLERLIEEGMVHLVSLNDHTPGQGQYRDIERYMKEMERWSKLSTDYSVMSLETVQKAQERPKPWEIIQQLAKRAHDLGIVVASHDDDTVEKVGLMSSFGVSLSEFPVTAEAAQAARGHKMAVVMGAPNALRGVSTSGNLSARDAIANGLVDILAADYHPGALLQSVCALVKLGLLDQNHAMALVTHNVASACKLVNRGSLIVGNRADIMIFDDRGEFPRVRMTLRNGNPIYMDGTTL